MIAEVTPQEAALADALGEIWNKYLELPVEHYGDQDEFCRYIHILQRQVTSRAGRRAMRVELEPLSRQAEAQETLSEAYEQIAYSGYHYGDGLNLFRNLYADSSCHTLKRKARELKHKTRALIQHDRIIAEHPRGLTQ